MEIIRNYEYVQNIDIDMVKEKLPTRLPSGHKGYFGTLLSISGSLGMAGAAMMCISAAIRCGVGLVKGAVPKGIYEIVAKQIAEAVFVLCDQNEEGTISGSSFNKIKSALDSATAAVVGCGLGWNGDTKEIVYKIIRSSEVPLLIDADGINVLSENIDILKEKKSEIILTPHIGEMARLMKASTEEIRRNKINFAKKLAKEYEITVVLKDHHTVIADKEGNVFMNRTGNSGMAKGGSGDVLSGIIGALLAQRISEVDAAICGVYLHGEAGDRCAQKYSETSMLPTDMINELKGLFLEIE